VVLVGHHSSSKAFGVQRTLATHLQRVAGPGRVLHVPVNITNKGVHPPETTQRTRSFLFASLGFFVAQMFGKDSFTFFENGVVSFNLPISGDVVGARATRTTHPWVIRGFESLFSALVQRKVEIRTPYLWHTKKEVVEKIIAHGQGQILAGTASCAHPYEWTQTERHCGVCSQCIDRRFAVLAAGLSNSSNRLAMQ
jgi:7-cyano-7-deazaguanine synthase in queuosine biosynthesis